MPPFSTDALPAPAVEVTSFGMISTENIKQLQKNGANGLCRRFIRCDASPRTQTEGICARYLGGGQYLTATGLHRRGEVDFLKQISAHCCQVQPLSANRRIRPRYMTKPSNCGGGGGGGSSRAVSQQQRAHQRRGGSSKKRRATQYNRKWPQ